jgi:hypothetical protein
MNLGSPPGMKAPCPCRPDPLTRRHKRLGVSVIPPRGGSHEVRRTSKIVAKSLSSFEVCVHHWVNG